MLLRFFGFGVLCFEIGQRHIQRFVPEADWMMFIGATSASRVGGGALSRWPPSASQTARARFVHAAFTKT
jgi:hypothetical protein